MKDKLKKLLAAKEARKAELGTKAGTTESVEELRGINTELEGLNAEIADLRSMLDAIEAEEAEEAEGEQRKSDPVGKGGVLGAFGMGKKDEEARTEDKYGTLEYRKAFMDFALKGVRSEALELRTDATAATTDVSAVIPTTIMNKIVEKMADYGRIWARVSKSSIRGGVEIPVSSLKPTAAWISEGSVAEKQKKVATAKISFSYYKLQVRVAVTLEADTVTLPVFESTVADNVFEAMIVGLETSIISGDGTGEPLGITKDTGVPADQIVEVAAADLSKYQSWTSLLAKVPRKYRNGAVIILNDADWNKYIVGMVDANGQPVARTTYGLDGIQTDRFLGKEVIAVEDYLTSFDDATAGDIFGVICKLSDYLVNSNLQMSIRRYFDENTDEWITKSTLIADGKLADKNGVVLLKKK